MKRADAAVFVAGFLLLVVAVSTVSWQLGLGVLGFGIMLSVIDPPRIRR